MKQIIVGQDERVGKWLCARTGGRWNGEGATFGVESDGRLVGAVVVDHYNGASAALHVAGEGNWLTRDLLFAVFDYCFRQLGLSVVMGFVSSANIKAQRFDEHLGFREVGRVENACPDGDLIIYAMRRDQCRYWRQHGK